MHATAPRHHEIRSTRKLTTARISATGSITTTMMQQYVHVDDPMEQPSNPPPPPMHADDTHYKSRASLARWRAQWTILLVVALVIIIGAVSLSILSHRPINNRNQPGNQGKPFEDRNSSAEYVALPTIVLDSTNLTFVNGSSFEIPKSEPDTLLTLTLLAADGNSFKPVGRSYDGKDWETSAGAYAAIVTFDCGDSDAYGTCLVKLPFPPADDDGSLYQVTLFDKHPYTERDIVARFLEQATFGASRKDIDAFFGDGRQQSPTTLDFAKWIHHQQTEVPVMSHREIFRKHLNAQFPVANPMGGITRPCDKNTRYRITAFTIKDTAEWMTIQTLNNTTTEKARRALLMEGSLRTVVGPNMYYYDDDWEIQPMTPPLPDGSYRICWVYPTPEQKIFSIKDPDTGNCIRMGFEMSNGDVVSNPIIEFLDDLHVLGSITAPLIVDISEESATPIDVVHHRDYALTEQKIILQTDLGNCPDVDPNHQIPVFVWWKDRLYIHDPRFVLLDNRVAIPLADGGGNTVKTFSDPYRPNFTTKCSNVPRTFLNEDWCYLSEDPSVCSADTSDHYKGNAASGSFEYTPIEIDHTFLRAVYDTTGAGEPGTAYVYSIDGLDISRDLAADPPCRPGSLSRWVSGSCSADDAIVSLATNQLMSTILAYFREESDNAKIVDIYHPEGLDFTCSEEDLDTVAFEINDWDDPELCWRNVHVDHGNIYDFTSWTFAHPGNADARNPISEVAEAGNTTLLFPSWHEMSRWQDNKAGFEGGYIKLGDTVDFYDLPEELVTEELAKAIGLELEAGSLDSQGNGNRSEGATIVCGSPFEVSNDPALGGSQATGAFDAFTRHRQTTFKALRYQRNVVWMKAVLEDPGQLRQRVAWALSQILVVSPSGIEGGTFLTEAFVTFYDIFIRNAFGNYRNVLREVAYSPMMADMLTYHSMKSTAAAWQENGVLSFADENFAREVLQLFTTGLFPLHDDGTKVEGSQSVYTNDDIEEYARAWTGFLKQNRRGNVEESFGNRIDPMRILDTWRDRFPKMGLNRQYVGDGFPLCSDLPARAFLAKGAKYVLLGSKPKMELHTDPVTWQQSNSNATHFSLSESSSLFAELCSKGEGGACAYQNIVQLKETLPCFGMECQVDTVRAVQVNGMFFEYAGEACVHQAFYKDAKTLVRKWDGSLMCGDPRVAIASAACCDTDPQWKELYWGENTIFDTAWARCSEALCKKEAPICEDSQPCRNNGFYWTAAPCDQKIKIDKSGKVAIVHRPPDSWGEEIDPLVQQNTPTFFRVDWETTYPGETTDCNAVEGCAPDADDLCTCIVTVSEEQIFLGPSLPTIVKILDELHIGSVESFAELSVDGDIRVYSTDEDGSFVKDTVFEFVDENGKQHRRKNIRSIVAIDGSNFNFRNPPHFMSLAAGEVGEAVHETEAVLDHYFYHHNTAPFLAILFAQRFGVSNPSPRYVRSIVNAFRSGTYSFDDQSFGSGEYGDLAATMAAVLLDDEARGAILDSDPSHGSFKEPLLKIMSLFRSLEFKLHSHYPWIEFSGEAGDQIGQMAHFAPSVFSFFLPEYQPAGRVSQSSLVAPEAQILTGPRIIDGFNGIFSLIKYGLSPCFGGFAEQERNWYCGSLRMGHVEDTLGAMTYLPSQENPEEVVDELATLLTSGRLSMESRRLIKNFLSSDEDGTSLLKAQMMVAASPEFHVTNVVRPTDRERDQNAENTPTSRPYKAVINIQLPGGADSHNLLVPHTCTGTNTNGLNLLDQYNNERSSIAFTDDERTRIIDVANQPCKQFAIHPDMDIVESLYNDGNLAFFANIGQLDTPVTKDDYYSIGRTELFAHNTMQLISQSIDPWDHSKGTGILGRFNDVLSSKGFNSQTATIAEATVATVGHPRKGGDPLIVSARGVSQFAPHPKAETFDIKDYIPYFNNQTSIRSSIYGETWSDRLKSAIGDAEELWESVSNVQLTQSYPGEIDSSGRKIKTLMSLMLTQADRGVDRDLFWLSLGSWDHHENLKPQLASQFQDLNGSLTLLVQELKSQGLFDSVTVVITSDFGRTLTANSGTGSDHAWGGNTFAFGGAVKGNQVLGEYPSDITATGPLNVGRGRFIPTLSWESMFNGVAEWLGIEDDDELDYCMPNRKKTGTHLFSKDELFSADARKLRGGGP